ncbi:glycerophosphoryl diester phosphodiesterase [Bacillus methanolicus PB1]|uniref:Glycerophosphoryl diester phosphodiesterase n=1 Tax=Bacillus methanolicus PB1 TaxID=997296 RepID=I3DW05_BACMT|nr:glycerophosphodiester phosphodiesterase family protein [Bacillus methanolicus]EIJ78426.1 glycerophosphoryl diester phosphodiesterase [Bacillus methanolicus PB1]
MIASFATASAAALLAGLMMSPSFEAKLSSLFEKEYRIETVAHRGASGYAPENTIAAFEKAFDMNADYFELDVQMSKDGELVIMHDKTVNRTTNGKGKVGKLTLKELRSLDAGSWFGPEFSGEQIPTLQEALDAFRGKIGILIELKFPELYPGIEQKVADTLIERNMHSPANEKIIVQSFNFESIKTFHKILPEVPVGVLTYRAQHHSNAMLQEFSRYADFVNPNKSLVSKKLTDRIHALGMRTMSWTVRSNDDIRRLHNAKVDGIITDYPDYDPRSR